MLTLVYKRRTDILVPTEERLQEGLHKDGKKMKALRNDKDIPIEG